VRALAYMPASPGATEGAGAGRVVVVTGANEVLSLLALLVQIQRCSVYLLYEYKSTNAAS
jgi:hypothetical protein